MKNAEERAFSSTYLANIHLGFYEDSKVFENLAIVMGWPAATMADKNKMTDSMERRMRACEACPIHILAVWDEEVVL